MSFLLMMKSFDMPFLWLWNRKGMLFCGVPSGLIVKANGV